MTVAYIVRSWPRLSQTFVLNEVLALERIGVRISIFAITKAHDPVTQPQVAEVAAPVHYLDVPEDGDIRPHLRLGLAAPRRYVSTLLFALFRRGLLGGYTEGGALRSFHRAVLIAVRLRPGSAAGPFTHVHAHFAHDPALLGLLVHRLTGLTYSFTAHARDLYQIPRRALLGRALEASAIVTCCRSNAEHIASVVGEAGPPVELIYHGVDLGTFRPRSEREENGVPLVVSVGRLVEKKGFGDLLEAFALLSRSHIFRGEIYGDGPLRAELEALRDRLGLANVVGFFGLRTQAELIPVYHSADVFALTPWIPTDGDRDGVPNVVFEAMASGLPIVATRAGGIPELVVDGADGLLAPPRDAAAIASSLAALLEDAPRRQLLGATAARTAAGFDIRTSAQRLAAVFDRAAADAR